ncbi:unnamed protein product [Pedinophyceae sp. YPF-701]|nr:unnamed protein product [Pedinophyceae sp. YPF-701]
MEGDTGVTKRKKRRLEQLEASLASRPSQGPPGRPAGAAQKRSGSKVKKRATQGDGAETDPAKPPARPQRGSAQHPTSAPPPDAPGAGPPPPHTDIVYRALPPSVLPGPLRSTLGLSPPDRDPSAAVSSFLESLMARNLSAAEARTAVGSKVAERQVLLDNPTAGLRRPQTTRFARHVRAKPLSAAAARKLRVLPSQQPAGAVPPAAVTALREAWQIYIARLLDGAQAPGARLAKASLCGADIRVEGSRDAQRVGVAGTVVRESRSALSVVDADGRVRCVPLRGSTLLVRLARGRTARVHGDALEALRSGKAKK